MKKERLEFIMKFPMIFGMFCFAFVFVARYIKPILELKIPSFICSLVYLIYTLIKFKREKN